MTISSKAVAKDLTPSFEVDSEDSIVKEYKELNDKIDIVLQKIDRRKKSRKPKSPKSKTK